MKKIILGILQGLARAFFVLSATATVVLVVVCWILFFKNGMQIALEEIIVFGQGLSEQEVVALLRVINANNYLAILFVAGFSILLFFSLWPLYLTKEFLLALRSDQWFHERNTLRLHYLAIYFFVMALLDVLVYCLSFVLLEGSKGGLTLGISSEFLIYFILGPGLLLLSFMHQQGVKLRQEAELIV